MNSWEQSTLSHTLSMNSCERSTLIHTFPVNSSEQSTLIYTLPVNRSEQSTSIHTLPMNSWEQSTLIHTLLMNSCEQSTLIHTLPMNSSEQSTLIHTLPMNSSEQLASDKTDTCATNANLVHNITDNKEAWEYHCPIKIKIKWLIATNYSQWHHSEVSSCSRQDMKLQWLTNLHGTRAYRFQALFMARKTRIFTETFLNLTIVKLCLQLLTVAGKPEHTTTYQGAGRSLHTLGWPASHRGAPVSCTTLLHKIGQQWANPWYVKRVSPQCQLVRNDLRTWWLPRNRPCFMQLSGHCGKQAAQPSHQVTIFWTLSLPYSKRLLWKPI